MGGGGLGPKTTPFSEPPWRPSICHTRATRAATSRFMHAQGHHQGRDLLEDHLIGTLVGSCIVVAILHQVPTKGRGMITLGQGTEQTT